MEKELLFQQEYTVAGNKVVFYLYREEAADGVAVTLSFFIPGQMQAEAAYRIFRFPKCAERVKSGLLSWYNLICCSNNYGPVPVVDYMNYSVQNGKKLAATVYPKDATEYSRILAGTESYNVLPYNVEEYGYELYISRTGTLADYFDFDEIMQVYEDCGVKLDRDKMRDYFGRSLGWFGNLSECPVNTLECGSFEDLAVTGLLFGYPVESTVAVIKQTVEECR